MAFSTAEIVQLSTELQNSHVRTIGAFMVNRFGIYYDQKPELLDLKDTMEKIMVREETQHPNGYTIYEWHDRY